MGGGRMLRVIRGLAALVALLAGLIGVPAALLVLGGNPLPATFSWPAVWLALSTPDDGMILLGFITIVGWAAWLVFASSVVTELAAVVTRQRIQIRLPGLGAPQRVAAGLIVAVLAILVTPQLGQAPAPGTTTAWAAPVEVTQPVADPAPVVVPAAEVTSAAAGSRITHVVARGDDLWSLAERYYGEGREWRKIANANPQLLTGGPDRLEPGWRLNVPDVEEPAVETAGRHTTVRRGDTLTRIAERELGSGESWPALYRLNRFQLDDPDDLPTGLRLLLPALSDPPSAAPSMADGPPDRSEPGSATPGRDEPGSEGSDPAPVPPAVTPPVPGHPLPTGSGIPAEPPPSAAERPAEQTEGWRSVDDLDQSALVGVGVGGLLAAGLLAGLAARRRIQLQTRPVGRRIAHPPAEAQLVETAMGHRQRPLSLRTLDRASRAVAAHCRRTGLPLPPLVYALVGEDELELVMTRSCPDAPVGFTVRGRSWVLDRVDAGYLSSVPGLGEAPRPWPALVTLGRDERDRVVVGDLEAMGVLGLASADPERARGVLAAMAVELSFSPWADEMVLTLVGGGARLPHALGRHNVTRTEDFDTLLERLEKRASAQRDQLPQLVRGQARIDPDLADPWAPEIVLVDTALTAPQRSRLAAVMTAEPRATLAAVVVDPAAETPWSLEIAGSDEAARLLPAQVSVRPQCLDRPTASAVVDLIAATGSDTTTPARWWVAASEHPDPPPDNVTYLGRRFGGWGNDGDDEAEGARMTAVAVTGAGVHHPTLQILGPVELLGAAGSPPPRAAKQCLEYCAWLLEHPGTTAQAMTNALIVAEGTRRSNMSRLRGWLGSDAAGMPYLPDAYTGRILLSPAVSSDWQQLQILTGPGVNRASTEGLRAALDLVRGAPLADAAPGQWHWAEELRTDMISCLRDIGVELTTRALDGGDIDLARWAAARALVAAPGDELLMAARIRTEHLAGNPAETERLTLQLAAQARTLGVDLDEATVVLLQQVMEGRVRARMA